VNQTLDRGHRGAGKLPDDHKGSITALLDALDAKNSELRASPTAFARRIR
jgi:hypothetical protein